MSLTRHAVDGLALGGIALAALVVLLLPIRFDYTIEATGRIVPRQEWVLTRGPEGQLITAYYDYLEGTTRAFTVAQYEQRDIIRFALNDSIITRGYVAAGDPVGAIYSNFVSTQIARLRGSIATENAMLRQVRTGERASVVAEAQQVLERARIQLDQQQRQVDRLRALAARNVISAEEMETAESTLQVFERNAQIAESQLASARTGAKPEQEALVRTRIQNLETELDNVLLNARDQTITSPISGILLKTPSPDTLLAVSDTSAFVVYIPVPIKHYPYVEVGQPLTIETLVRGQRLQGYLLRREPVVRSVEGVQVLIVQALIEHASGSDLLPGLTARCRIKAGKVTPLEYVRRFSGRLFR